MSSFELRYQCLALAQAELVHQSKPYKIDDLFHLANQFCQFVEGKKTGIADLYETYLSASTYINKHFVIVNPVKGLVPFKLYPHQERTLRFIQEQDIALITSARQMGLTTLLVAYGLYLALTKPSQNIVFVGVTNRNASDLYEIAWRIYEHLTVDKPVVLSKTASEMEFANGSLIARRPANVESLRGRYADLTILDQFGSVRDNVASDLWQSIAASRKIIVGTTPNHEGSFFHALWTSKAQHYGKLELPYYLHHPQKSRLENLRDFSREFECRFAAAA